MRTHKGDRIFLCIGEYNIPKSNIAYLGFFNYETHTFRTDGGGFRLPLGAIQYKGTGL